MFNFIKKIPNTYRLTFSNGGNILIGLSDEITLYNTNNYTEILSFNEIKEINHVIFSHNNDLLAVKSSLGVIGVYDLKKMQFMKSYTPECDSGDGCNIFFTPDDKYIIDGDWEGNIRLINLENDHVKIIKKFDNSKVQNIEYDSIDKSYHVFIHYRGSFSLYEPSYNFVSIWNYDDNNLLWVYDTRHINRITPLTRIKYDCKRKRYVDIQKNRNHKYELIVVDNSFSKIISRVPFDIISSILEKIVFSPSYDYLFAYINKTLYIMNGENYDILKSFKFEGNIEFSSDEELLTICTSKGDGYITTIKDLLSN